MIRSFQDKIGEARARQMQADLSFFLFDDRRGLTTHDDTLPETNSSPLKMDGWKMYEDVFPFGARPIFRGELLVSGRVVVVFFEIGVSKQTP